MIIIYGIPNCDVVKKALAWLKTHKIVYEFHNFKTQGISREKLSEWINKAGVEHVINKRSTTWRNLSPELQLNFDDIKKLIEVATLETSIIKRPVLEYNDLLLFGFNEQEYKNKIGSGWQANI